MPDPEIHGAPPVPHIGGADAWLRSSSYWRPDHTPTSAWYEHSPFAFWIIDALRPRSVVELGTHFGFSYFVFCQAIARLGLDSRAYALDTWRGDEHAGFYEEDVFTSVSDVNRSKYSSFSTLLRGYFDESLDKIPDGSVDLLHFDGRHAYLDIKHDFNTWLPKFSARGVALFHDIAEHQQGFGVWRFWQEIENSYPSFAFHHQHGLGVLGVGTEQSGSLTEFFRASQPHAERIRQDYEALGAAVAAQVTTSADAAEAIALRAEVGRLTGEVRARDTELRGLNAIIDDYRTSTSWKITGPLRAVGSIGRRR